MMNAHIFHNYRDYKKPQCSGYGQNSKFTYLRLDLLAEKGDDDYCGIFTSNENKPNERSIVVAIRNNRTLESQGDKLFMISCDHDHPGCDSEQLGPPILTVTCRAGIMMIKLQTLLNFSGVIHSR